MTKQYRIIPVESLQVLFNKYYELLQFEVEELGVEPTECRHLIGRLGEIWAAIQLGGQLAKYVNQEGFDLIVNGKLISVKTTAQTGAYIPLNEETTASVDLLLCIQYRNGKFKVLYFGKPAPAIRQAKMIKAMVSGNLKFTLSRARRIQGIYGMTISRFLAEQAGKHEPEAA